MEFVPFELETEFSIGHLSVRAVAVNHQVPTVGLIISDSKTTIAMSSDTAETERFWEVVNSTVALDSLFVETSFPNAMSELADVSKHLTPASLSTELKKLSPIHSEIDILIVHIKPTFRDAVIRELCELAIPNLSVMEPGRDYEW
jgi:cAMP phosphodiesterase